MTDSTQSHHKQPSLWQRPTIWLLVLLVFTAILSLPEFAASISGDTAIYAYIGRAIAHGQVLYRDVWDFKAPGIYYFFAFLFRFLPDSLTTLRLAALVCIEIGIVGFWFLVRRFFIPTTAFILTAFLAVWIHLGGVFNGDGPFPETFILPLIVLVYLTWYQFSASKQVGWLFLTGLLIGASTLLKQTGIATLLAVVLILIIEGAIRLRSVRQTILAIVVLSVGYLVTIVPWFFYFSSQNAFQDMRTAVFQYPVLYAGTTPITEAITNAITLIGNLASVFGLLYVMVPVGLWLYWRQHKGQGLQAFVRSPFFALIVWAIIETVVVSAPRRFYGRYFLQPLPALLLIAGLGIEMLVIARSNAKRDYRALLPISLIVLFVVSIVGPLPRTLAILNHRVIAKEPSRAEALAAYLKQQNSAPFDAIFAWGDNRAPFVTGHPSGVKWINTEPFQTSQSFSTDPQVMDELLHELQTNPPRYLFQTTQTKDVNESYLAGTEVDKFIQQHYHLITQIQDGQLYEYQ
jgi:hypothetical protein